MSFRSLAHTYSYLHSNPLLFLDVADGLAPKIESMVNDLRRIDTGIRGPDLLDAAVLIISKLKTSPNVSLTLGSVPQPQPQPGPRPNDPRAAVEDRFFKLSELEDFLDQQDRQFEQQDEQPKQEDENEDDDEEEVDFFAEVPDEDDDEAMFTDFFDQPKRPNDPQSPASDADSDADGQDDDDDEAIDTADFDPEPSASGPSRDMVVASDSDSEASDVDEESGPKSWYQKKKEAEQEKMRKMEKQMLGSKHWQLSGEVTAAHRPENSLLEEHLQFDYLSRQAPLVTEDVSHRIEDIIRQRIKNESWDDVVRKKKPNEEAYEFKRRITLEQEKSKASLAQVYEKEYLKTAGEVADDKEDPAHTQIKKMARMLFAKLDALSSFHFTPRLPEPELKIINNLPAVMAEEAIPAAVSESTLLAPEEVSRKTRRELMSVTEKSSTDRMRERRSKKRFQKAKKLFVESKKSPAADPVSTNKYNKLQRELAVADAIKKLPTEKLADANTIRSSKSFFAQLDDRISQAKAGRANTATKKTINSKALKL